MIARLFWYPLVLEVRESMQPTYSICVTNFNTVDSIVQSLESILAQVDERFEIIVVDNCSNDGSLEILREYQSRGVKLIVKQCSIGLGRQTAIENSRGKYIITNMDMDDVFKPNLNKLVRIYHSSFEGYMIVAQSARRGARIHGGKERGIMIATRELIDAMGGFRDVNAFEDRDLWARAAKLGNFRFLKSFPIIDHSIDKPKLHRRIIAEFKRVYFFFRESFRLGYGKRFCYRAFVGKPVFFLPRLLIAFWAFVTHLPYPHFHNEFIRAFNIDDYEVEIDESFE